MNLRLPSLGTLRPIIVMAGVAVALALIVVVALATDRSDASTSTAAACELGPYLENDFSESSGVLPSGQQLRVMTVAAPGEEEAISVRKAVFAECTKGGAMLVNEGITTLSWRTDCGSGLLMRVGEESVIVIVEDPAC